MIIRQFLAVAALTFITPTLLIAQTTSAPARGQAGANRQGNSLEAIERRFLAAEEQLTRLKATDSSKMSDDDRWALDVEIRRRELEVAENKSGLFLIVLHQRSGVQITSSPLGLRTVQQFDGWVRRMDNLPAEIDQNIDLMREGIRRKIVLPKSILQRVIGQVDRQLPRDPDKSPFFTAFLDMPKEFSDADKTRIVEAARKSMKDKVIPAFTKLRDFLRGDYMAAAFPEAGIWQMPDGARTYATLARRHTTTDMTPQQIHDLGLKEVERIRAEMEKVKELCGFHGPLNDFFKKLRTDRKYFFRNGDELLTSYRALAKRIDPLLPRIFKLLPRQPYGVEPVPMASAPETTTAYYQASFGRGPGTYFVNLYKPESRPRWEMLALTLHESVPGHHLQQAYAGELTNVPAYLRRQWGATAYVEGWGLYAESLGEDLGLYTDPYDRMGKLTYEMWRSIRLVVDTGMHAFHWPRERAIKYFLDNAPKTELDVTNEIDRYITMPGQALAYKIGELKLKELRAKAEKTLGTEFDLRDFHDLILRTGSVPIATLEREVDKWLKGRVDAGPAPTSVPGGQQF